MTVNELCEKSGFEAVVLADGEREVGGCYVGDLLSWVMGRAQADNLWMTIMTNINVAAVAQLSDVAAVLICEGARPDDSVISVAVQKGVNILLTSDNAYNTAVKVSADI